MQVFPLRGQERGIDRAVSRDLVDIVRDQALQKPAAIRARYGEDAAIVEHDEIALCHRAVPLLTLSASTVRLEVEGAALLGKPRRSGY